MDFNKISFRTTPEEEDYLQELAERFGASSVTDFMHRFLADCMKTNVGNVYSRNLDRVLGRTDRPPLERSDTEQTPVRQRSLDNSLLSRYTTYVLDENRRLRDEITRLRRDYDALEQQVYWMSITRPIPTMLDIKPQEPDLMSSMIADMEKNNKFVKAWRDMSLW